MSAAAELFVKVSADVKGLTAGMDEAAKAIDHIGEETKKAEAPLVRFRDILAGTAAGELLADGIKSAASAMVDMGQQSIKLAGELEQNKVAFTAMLGGADKADAMLRELATFAANTPFELRGLTDSTKKLLAFGFDAKSVIPIMNSVGNAVAAVGGGKDVLDGVTMALGQMAAKGKVSAEEMNQLAERGIPAWKMLADGIGVSVPEAMKKAEKGSIDAGTAITALVNGMNQKFPGMMQKQSQTIMGALSNLQDSADAALTKIGQKLIETFNLTRVVQGLSAAVSNLTEAFTTGGLLAVLDRAFGPTTKAAILGLGVAVTATFIPALAAAAGTLATTAAAAAPFIAIASAVAFAAYPIVKNWDAIKGTITALWDTAAQYTSAYYNRAVRIASNLADNFATAFRYIGDAIRGILGDELTNKLLGGLSRTAGAFKGFAQVAVTPLKVVGSVASAAASNFAETWRGAMSMSQGFTSDLFRQAGASTRDFGKTLTADMLGLAKASATAAGGATKAASAAKAHAAELKKVEVESRKLEVATARNLKRWQEQEAATYALGQRLAAVMAESEKLGRAFDLAGAQAGAYSQSIADIKRAFGEFSPQAILAQQEINKLRAASEGGGAALAKAYLTIKEAGAALEEASVKAAALGQEFNSTDEAVKLAEGAMVRLIEQGLRPGNAAFDEQLKKLRNLQAEQAKQPRSLDAMVKGQNDLVSSLREVGTSITSITSMMGIQLPEVASVAASALAAGALAVGGLILAVNGLTVAWATFTAAFATNPIGAILLGVGAAIVGIVAAVNAVRDHERKVAEEAAVAMQKAQEEAQRARDSITSSITSGFKTAAKAFIDGAEDWGQKLRQQMREGLIQGVLDALMAKELMANLTDLYQKVMATATDPLSQGFRDAVAAFGEGVDREMKKLEPVFKAAGDVINTYLPQTAAEVDKQTKATKNTISRAGSSGSEIDSKSRDALGSYQSNLLATVQKYLNQGADNPSSPLHGRYLIALDQANKAARDLRGMATGGLVTGPTIARMGEGGRNEAVLPLNENVYRQIGEGIAAARGGGSGMQLVVNYSGSGKWTREDAQGLGRLLVSELRSMGVRA